VNVLKVGAGDSMNLGFGDLIVVHKRTWLFTLDPQQLLDAPDMKRLAWQHLKKMMMELKHDKK
jgi:hypothetical protein